MSGLNKPEAIRTFVTDAVAKLMRGVNKNARMTGADVEQLATFVATASVAVLLSALAAEMRKQEFDETRASTPGGIALDDIATARDLGYRAGHNDAVKAWAKLLSEAGHESA